MHTRTLKLLTLLVVAAPLALVAAEPTRSTLVIHAEQGKATINRNLYGHFAEHLGRCVYEGIWVGEDSSIPNTRGIRNDVVAALKEIKVPVLRWPGGCFADEYHWKDGIGPREQRPKVYNSHWGGVVENNHFGTHEFMDLCEQIGAEPYIAINVGSGTVREMMQWIEYLTSAGDTPMANLRRQHGRDQPWKVRYFGIGNESWGCGGAMRPEYYADVYRQYQEFARNYGDNLIYKIACGASDSNYRWTEVLMENVGRRMHGLSLHYYTLPTGNWRDKGSATQFGEPEWHATLRRTLEMDGLIRRHSEIMDRFDREKRIGLIVDEWGTWYNVEPGTNPGFLYQQSTLRDALVAGINLNIFNRHCERVTMANIAQTINVLQAMILTDKARMLKTPTFHVFEMYTVHHDATWLPADLTTPDYEFEGQKVPALQVSASRDKSGAVQVSLCNLDANRPADLRGELRGATLSQATGRVLTADALNAHNTFEQPDAVKPAAFSEVKVAAGGFTATLPPRSVVVLKLQ